MFPSCLVGGIPTLWKIWKSVGISIPNVWENRTCSKPPTRYVSKLWILILTMWTAVVSSYPESTKIRTSLIINDSVGTIPLGQRHVWFHTCRANFILPLDPASTVGCSLLKTALIDVSVAMLEPQQSGNEMNEIPTSYLKCCFYGS